MTLLRGVLSKSILCSVVLAVVASSTVVAAQPPTGTAVASRIALTGRAAAEFKLPSDVQLVSTWHDRKHNLTYQRYQQIKQPFKAAVEGAQMTVVTLGRETVLVTGLHYANLAVTNRLLVTGADAAERAEKTKTLRGAQDADGDASASTLKHRVDLHLNPLNGRLFQYVTSGTFGLYVITEIDAETGEVIASWDALPNAEPGMGTGVKGDRKSLTAADPDLSDDFSGTWRMQTDEAASRLRVLDSGHANPNGTMNTNWPVMTDSDNDWAGTGQRAAVDAQYYASLTDEWYLEPAHIGGFDLVSDCDAAGYADIRSAVHMGNQYDNAFFDPDSGMVAYGDGDGFQFINFAGSQDVVAHEITHRVTTCRTPEMADNYFGQPGALNEALSDMMASAMEWDFNEQLSSNCRRQVGQTGCPDWWVGEDIVVAGDFGFRSLADPEASGQPGHWADRACTNIACPDRGGVHLNATIPGHAFYLLVNGGRNARCSGSADPQADCDVVVPAIPLVKAAEIFFAAWGSLTSNATFCDAHQESVLEASIRYPEYVAAVDLAWTAVGRGYGPDSSASGDCPLPTNQPYIGPTHTLTLGPGGSGSIDVAVHGASGLTATDDSPATVDYDSPNTEIDVSVPVDMPEGVYPILLTGSDGSTAVYAGATLLVDATDPVVALNGVSLNNSGTVSASGTVPLIVNWSASDATSGVSSSNVQRLTAPNTWANVSSGAGPSTVITGNSSETFRVIATDGAGNVAMSPESGPWNIGRFQETAVTILKGTWTTTTAAGSWGGSVRYATASGAAARFVFTGNQVTWVSTRAGNKGKAKVYIDGVFQRKVNLAAGTLGSRQIVYRATGLSNASHTLRITVVTSGKRVEIDGFVTLSH